jgi:hypothetical protein
LFVQKYWITLPKKNNFHFRAIDTGAAEYKFKEEPFTSKARIPTLILGQAVLILDGPKKKYFT